MSPKQELVQTSSPLGHCPKCLCRSLCLCFGPRICSGLSTSAWPPVLHVRPVGLTPPALPETGLSLRTLTTYPRHSCATSSLVSIAPGLTTATHRRQGEVQVASLCPHRKLTFAHKSGEKGRGGQLVGAGSPVG